MCIFRDLIIIVKDEVLKKAFMITITVLFLEVNTFYLLKGNFLLKWIEKG